MSGLVGTLADHLGERLRSGITVRRVTLDDTGGWRLDADMPVEARSVVLALAPHQAAPLLGGALETVLSQMPAAPVAVVALGGPGDRLPAGFGYLVAPGAGAGGDGLPVRVLLRPGTGSPGSLAGEGRASAAPARATPSTWTTRRWSAVLDEVRGRRSGPTSSPT